MSKVTNFGCWIDITQIFHYFPYIHNYVFAGIPKWCFESFKLQILNYFLYIHNYVLVGVPEMACFESFKWILLDRYYTIFKIIFLIFTIMYLQVFQKWRVSKGR